MSAAAPSRYRHVAVAAAIVALAAYWALLTDDLFPGGDNARYIVFAESIVAGHGYRRISLLAAPPHTLAPPGFAALLAAAIWLLGAKIVALKALVGCFAALSVGAAFAALRRRTGERVAVGASVLYAMSPVVFTYSRRVYADLPFAAVSLLALVAVERYGRDAQSRLGELVTAVALLAAGFYLRPIGLVLWLAGCIWLVHRRQRRKSMLLVAPALPLLAPWFAWTRQVGAGGATGHAEGFFRQPNASEQVRLLAANAASHAGYLADSLWYVPGRWLEHAARWGVLQVPDALAGLVASAAAICACSLIVVGLARTRRHRAGLAEVYVTLYCLAVLAWPWAIDRFLIPIMPFLILYYLRGVAAVAAVARIDRRRTWLAQATAGLLVLALLASGLAHAGARIYQERRLHAFAPGWDRFYELARWSRAHLPEDAVVMTDQPDFYFVYSGRRTVEPGIDPSSADWADTPPHRRFAAVSAAFGADWADRLWHTTPPPPLHCTGDSRTCLYPLARP